MKMILAIVGTRDGMNKAVFDTKVDYYIRKWGKPDMIVSGGCRGIDYLAKIYAKEHDIPFQEFLPQSFFGGKPDFLGRNTQIAEICTHCLAFPGATSRGTWDTIRKATQLKRKIKIIQV